MVTGHHSDPSTYQARRQHMVASQIAARGIHSAPVLSAMNRVAREAFLPPAMQAFAYDDSPLPIDEGQTISQPYIVAAMIDALALQGGERVLEIGTGSGYAACVLGEIAGEVYTIERHTALAGRARELIAGLGYEHIEVIHADGTLGWPPAAPYQAIVVTAGGPSVPEALKRQLAIGGRLVIPVGAEQSRQVLIRLTRIDEDHYREERLSDVRFVPLIGEQGWAESRPGPGIQEAAATLRSSAGSSVPLSASASTSTSAMIAAAADPLVDPDSANIDPLLERIGDARLVLIGEASHGTSEFYRFRAHITRQLIERRGFNRVAIEADWPDAQRIDHYVRHIDATGSEWTAFSRFPTWMWRNREVRAFVDWLHDHNAMLDEPEQRVSFHGLDLYSLFGSIAEVLAYLERVDPDAAQIARERYGCLSPWQANPAAYGRAAISGHYRDCRDDVAKMLADLLDKRMQYRLADGGFFNAVHNARLVANAERYYRAMYEGYDESWNLRDSHMFETLQSLLEHRSGTRIVVWAHNSHLGDARATEPGARGQHNVGQLCRQAFGSEAYLIGMGTHAGTVAAASDWGGALEFKTIRPSLHGSWERLCHESGVPAFTFGLRAMQSRQLAERLAVPQLERAIGVIYRPETERVSHYFSASLARQFDEYVWFDHTAAVTPLATEELEGMPETYPFGV